MRWATEQPDRARRLRARIRHVGHVSWPTSQIQVFFGMIRGAERAASERGFTMLVVESQNPNRPSAAALERLMPVVDGAVLGSSRCRTLSSGPFAERKAGWC